LRIEFSAVSVRFEHRGRGDIDLPELNYIRILHMEIGKVRSEFGGEEE
jgi:hypothetical protein